MGGLVVKPGVLIGKYRLSRQIGEGAMGAVWAATHEQTGGEVALKLITKSTPELRHRLLREARACAQLRHRNLIEVHDVGETEEGDPFLVMPLLTGETLADYLGRKRRLDVHEAAQIARDVAKALGTAHAQGIIHRDLKPANVFLHQEPGSEGAVVKVLDFGVSKNLGASDGLTTVAGGVVGSPAYMSPEQTKGEKNITLRADIWSLGVLLFEMLTGVRPFQGDSSQILIKIGTGEIPVVSRYLRNVDPSLVQLVSRCMERDPQKRFASANDLAGALHRFTVPSTSVSGSYAAAAVPSNPGLGQSGSSWPQPDPSAQSSIRSPRAVGGVVAPPPAPSSPSLPAYGGGPPAYGGAPANGPPVMPGMGGGDEPMTAKLDANVLANMAKPPIPPRQPMPSAPAFGSSPNYQSPAFPPPMPQGGGTQPVFPTSGAELEHDMDYRVTAPLGRVASPDLPKPGIMTTAPLPRRIDGGGSGSASGPSAPTSPLDAPAQATDSWWASSSAADEKHLVTTHGTVRISPENVAAAVRAAPPPAPPPPSVMFNANAPTSSTAPFTQQPLESPPLSPGPAAKAPSNRKTGLIVVAVLAAMGLLVLSLGIVKLVWSRGDAAAASSAAVSASAVVDAAPKASASVEAPAASAEEPAPAASASAQSPAPSAPAAKPAAKPVSGPKPAQGAGKQPPANVPPWLQKKHSPTKL